MPAIVVQTILEQSQRADDLWFLSLGCGVVSQAEPVLLTQRHDDFGQLIVGNATAKLPVKGVHCRGTQGIAIDVVDGLMERVHVEQLALDRVGVGFEASVCAEARTGGPP